MPPLAFFIIDDEPEILGAVKTVLEAQGHHVTLANIEDPQYLLKLKDDQSKPDFILLDILLSGHDGRAICRELKSDPRTSAIPIIMFSAYPNAADSALAAGANAFLSKPFGLRELLSAVKKILKQN